MTSERPDDLPRPTFYRVRAEPDAEVVPLTEGRLAFDHFTAIVKKPDGSVLDLEIRVRDGAANLYRVGVTRNDDQPVPMTSLRHHALQEHMERALAQLTLKPDDDAELIIERPSPAGRKAAQRAVRRRNTPELLEEVAERYREGGTSAVVAKFGYDERHARRLVRQARDAGLNVDQDQR